MSVTEMGQGGRFADWPRCLPFMALFGIAMIVRALVPDNTDVSWGLTMAEKWLDGARLYVDIVEVNPPATIYLYVAPIWLGRLTGLRAELMVDALVLLAAAFSLVVTARLIRPLRLVDERQQFLLLMLLAAAVLILPAQTFGEREHIAVIAVLPFLAIMMRRAERSAVPLWGVLIAGAGAGLVAIVKPHLAAGVAAMAAVAALNARNWRVVLAPENFIAAGLLAIYVGIVLIAHPEFYETIMPLLLLAYVPAKERFASFITHVATPLWACCLLLTVRLVRGQVLAMPVGLTVAASVGFSVAYFVQQKGWPYQSYPMLAFGVVSLGLAAGVLWRARTREWMLAGAATLGIAVAAFTWFNLADRRPGLAEAVTAIKPNPKLLQLSIDLSVGHPLTRQVAGSWVSRVGQLWLTFGAELRRDRGGLDAVTAARLDAAAALDRRMLAEDIVRHRPDIVLVQRSTGFDMLAWAMADPALGAALAPYSPRGTVGDIILLGRGGG